jgi:HEAT repeat protein
VARAPDGPVQFIFAARPGVCGNGRSYISTGPSTYIGSFSGSINDVVQREPCEPGPVRVVLTRADGEVIDIDTYVGRPSVAPGATDLGEFDGRETADYLLSLAARAEGRPSQQAIFPAMLAEGANPGPALLSLARDKSRPRETRRSAISWLGRQIEGATAASPRDVTAALLGIARDDADNQAVRQHAVSALARLDNGDGIPLLMDLARSGGDVWLAKQAITALARSGDPRARDWLRSALQRGDMPEDMRVVAIRGIGREYATSRDAELLRGLYPRLTGDTERESVLAAVGEIGGAENVRWLLGVARSEDEPIRMRRRALASAEKAGAPIGELVRLYDSARDPQMKEALMSIYARSGEKAATDKLISIARTEDDRAMRRRAIARLSKSDDPRVKQLLQEIVER